MKTLRLGTSDLVASRIAYGCMRIGGAWDGASPPREVVRAAIETVAAAVDCGITLFDHADVYGRGRCETVFGAVMREIPGLRERIVLQSKCGIRVAGEPDAAAPGRYDFSRRHILDSVDGMLRRFGTERIDVLLLHRPDALVEPEEVASAFDELHAAGKVLAFGLSNHTAAQIELLRHYVKQPLIANQLQFSLTHAHLVEEGIIFNQDRPEAPIRNNGTLEYCRLHRITIQPWSPLAGGAVGSGTDARITRINELAGRLAAQRGVSIEAIWMAWVLRHPAAMQPIIGTLRPERIRAACQGDAVDLTREEWYALLTAARGGRVT